MCDAFPHLLKRWCSVFDSKRLPSKRDRKNRIVTEHSVARYDISGRLQPKQKQFARPCTKCNATTRLPKVDFVDTRLRSEEIEPI